MVKYATRFGILGLIIWSAGALFNSIACMLPTFEILFIALGLGFLAGAVHLTLTQSWHKIKPKSPYVLVGFIGIFGNELCYVSAFKFAPAAHITLINYLWPIIVVAISSYFSKDKFNFRMVIAAILGFCSIAYLIMNDSEVLFDYQCWFGYLLVILGTMMWSTYILSNQKGNSIASEMIIPYCGMGALISLGIHYQTETFVIPDLQQSFALLWLGIMSMYVAFRCWNFGISHGKVSTLSVLSYNNVMISTLLLIIFNQTTFNPQLIFSVLGLMLASALSIFEFNQIKNIMTKIFIKKEFETLAPNRTNTSKSAKIAPP